MQSKSEGRILWVLLFAVVVLAVLCLNSGCSTVQGICRDVESASRAVASAASEGRQ